MGYSIRNNRQQFMTSFMKQDYEDGNNLERHDYTEAKNAQDSASDTETTRVKDEQHDPTSRHMQEILNDPASYNQHDKKHDNTAIKIQDSQNDAIIENGEDRLEVTESLKSQDINGDAPPSNGHFRLGEEDAAEELSSNIEISGYQGQDVFSLPSKCQASKKKKKKK